MQEINADRVQELTEEFSYQKTLEDMVSSENIVDAMILNKNTEVIASSNKDVIGIQFDDIGSWTAAASINCRISYSLCISLIIGRWPIVCYNRRVNI